MAASFTACRYNKLLFSCDLSKFCYMKLSFGHNRCFKRKYVNISHKCVNGTFSEIKGKIKSPNFEQVCIIHS